MGNFILSMACVNGDNIQMAIHRREDIIGWLRKVDHEGSNWDILEHVWDAPYPDNTEIIRAIDLTDEIMREYETPT